MALTASAFEEERTQFLAIGCDDFLRKPVRAVELLEMIRQHLGVEYVYRENGDYPAESSLAHSAYPTSWDAEQLQAEMAQLPLAIRAKLEEAAVRIDMDSVNELIKRVRQQNPSLADILYILADDFDYEQILFLLQRE